MYKWRDNEGRFCNHCWNGEAKRITCSECVCVCVCVVCVCVCSICICPIPSSFLFSFPISFLSFVPFPQSIIVSSLVPPTLPAYQLSVMTYSHTSPSKQKTTLRCIAWRTRECPEHWWREQTDVHDSIAFCNISFNTVWTTRIIEFESSQSTSFVALDESLMILCDKFPRHPCQTTTIYQNIE